jgi:micrococcal nuclease
MIQHAKKLFISTLAGVVVLTASFVSGQDVRFVSEKVLRVIDGDTIEISGGDRVRLLGIDAPEKGEPIFALATDRLKGLTKSGPVTLEVCEDRDIYGRLLATVRIGKSNINSILLTEGLALPMLIPPCGRPVAGDVLEAAAQGALSGKGIYSLKEYAIVPHAEAGEHIGENSIVWGKILNMHRGKKALQFNFGVDWKTDFTAVLFRAGQQRFRDLDLDPVNLVGSEVLVIGKVKRYNGAEIIVRGPDQIIPLEGMTMEEPKSKIQGNDTEN